MARRHMSSRVTKQNLGDGKSNAKPWTVSRETHGGERVILPRIALRRQSENGDVLLSGTGS
jgi:hypothetical protein